MGDGGGGHCLIWMEWCPARWSVCLPLLILPCTTKSRSSLLATVSWVVPEKGHKTLMCVCGTDTGICWIACTVAWFITISLKRHKWKRTYAHYTISWDTSQEKDVRNAKTQMTEEHYSLLPRDPCRCWQQLADAFQSCETGESQQLCRRCCTEKQHSSGSHEDHFCMQTSSVYLSVSSHYHSSHQNTLLCTIFSGDNKFN